MTKAHLIIVNPLLLENYRFFPNLFNGGNTGLLNDKNELLKGNGKLPQYIDDKVSSQNSRLSLPLSLFHSAFDKVHVESHACGHIAQYKCNQC